MPDTTSSPSVPTVEEMEHTLRAGALAAPKGLAVNNTSIATMIRAQIQITKREIHDVLDIVVRSPEKTKDKIRRALQKNQVSLTEIARQLYRFRHYATLAAVSTVYPIIADYVALCILLLQVSLIVGSAYVYSRGTWNVVTTVYFKICIVLLRILRKLLQLPFDIPATILSIGRRKSLQLTESEIKKLVRTVRRDLGKLNSNAVSNVNRVSKNYKVQKSTN